MEATQHLDSKNMTNQVQSFVQNHYTIQAQSYQEAQKKEREEEQKKGAAFFRSYGFPTILYAIWYTFCLYENGRGVTVPLFMAATIALIFYVVKKENMAKKRDTLFVCAVMLLLGLSTCLTDSTPIVILNTIITHGLTVSVLIHCFANDREWSVTDHLRQLLVGICCAIGMCITPVTDLFALSKTRETDPQRKATLHAVLAGIALSVPVLLILGFLLSSADLIFGRMMGRLFSWFYLPENLIGIGVLTLFAFLASYCGLRYVTRKAMDLQPAAPRAYPALTAIIVSGATAVLYLAFSLIQILYLFIGRMTLPEGVTYAQYARSGFFQLLFVCLLNLLFVQGIQKHFAPHRLLTGLLLLISLTTYVMIASSALRMIMYIRAYHLTFLRVAVLVSLLTISVLLFGVILLLFHRKFPFARYAFVIVSVIYTLFAFSHADYWIASYNLSRLETEGAVTLDDPVNRPGYTLHFDFDYLSLLSTDAAPAIHAYVLEHPKVVTVHQQITTGSDAEAWTAFAMQDIWYHNYLMYTEQDRAETSLRKWNLSHWVASHILYD